MSQPLTWNDVIRFADGANPRPPKRIERTPEEWRSLLPADRFQVTRLSATERPFSSEMCSRFEPGRYACGCCETVLFDSAEKFESRTGWPSFTAPVDVALVGHHRDDAHGMRRIEVTCNVCDAHLGHVFPDGPPPSGLRYCINGLALEKVDVPAPDASPDA